MSQSDETTVDAFLGGRLQIKQPRLGYRAGLDPVLLAAAVPARTGEAICELGCGVGTALWCLARRVGDLRLVGIERHAQLLSLAQENAALNQIPATLLHEDITEPSDAFKQMSFDHVIANPPFFDRARGSAAYSSTRESGRGQDTALLDWVKLAYKRLKPKGYAHFLINAAQFPEISNAFFEQDFAFEAYPIAAYAHRPARTLLIRARKGGKSAFSLHFPIILHPSAPQTAGKVDKYQPAIEAVLRDGAALTLPQRG